jgi:hypothetical protein
MKSFNTKLTLAALGIAMLATPALAQRPHRQQSQQQLQYQVAPTNQVGTYPNGAPKTGSAAAQDSGADFNLLRQ